MTYRQPTDYLPPPIHAIVVAVFVPAIIAVIGVAIALLGINEQGLTLFVALPFFQTFLSALILRTFQEVSWKRSYWTSMLSVLALSFFILIFSIDGLICLLMALPFVLIQAIPGSLLGYFLARKISVKFKGLIPLFLIAAYPGMLGFEQKFSPPPNVHEVTTCMVIDAPIDKVWEQVIATDKIEEPPGLIFRAGVAYPVQIITEGQGVGATRNCIFSTGPFVEPITVWDPPHRLEFDVASNPPAIEELSPHGHIETPHLHETFISQRGRFRLSESGGQTILEGTSWYYQRIKPDWYWHHISDAIIHQVHLRVFEQIKKQAES